MPAPDYVLITDSSRFDPIISCKNLPAGNIVILRDYDLTDTQRLALAHKLRAICNEKKHIFLVAKTADIAEKAGADGVHLPEFMLKHAYKIRRKHPEWVITAAAHSRLASVKAANAGIDAVLISPVFKTDSHKNKYPIGIYGAKRMILQGMVAYGLGGCSPAIINRMKTHGFQGVAAISGLQ